VIGKVADMESDREFSDTPIGTEQQLHIAERALRRSSTIRSLRDGMRRAIVACATVTIGLTLYERRYNDAAERTRQRLP